MDHIISKLEAEFGKETPLTVHRRKVHNYLGMIIDFSEPGKVIFSMNDCIDRMLKEAPEDLMKGSCSSPAAHHLFAVDLACEKLDSATAIIYHHITAQLLYLRKRTRPNLLLAISFLCTRAQEPGEDDWKKLGRCLRFLRETKKDKLTLEADGSSDISWLIDASCAVHPNMRSHIGATMSMGKGCPISISAKQKLSTRSSAEAEIVSVSNTMYLVL